MVPREQNFRDLPAAKFRWSRVLRCFEETGAETVVGSRLLVTKHASQQAGDGIDQKDRRDCTVRQHVITNGDLKIDKMFDHPMIDSFVVPTNDNKMEFLCQLSRHLLIKTPPRWRHQ